MITEDSIITFHKISCSDEPDEHNLYTLTRIDTGVSKKLDKNVIALVENLSKGMTVLEAAYAIGFSVNVVLSVLEMLQNVHFVKHLERVAITEHSIIEFYNFRISPQPDDHNLFGIVRWDTDDTLKVDKNVVELIRHLSSGKTVKEAAAQVNFSVDVVLSLLKMFQEAHFFSNINGIHLYDSGKVIKPWLSNLGPEWFIWSIYKPLRYFLFIVGISGIVMGLFMNGIPTYKSFFWSPDIFVVFVAMFLIEIPIVFAHELAHFSVTKAVGGEAAMNINYRYIFIVAETESFHLGVVPKRQRYLIYLAGVTWDVFLVGVLYWYLLFTKLSDINIGLLHNFIIAVILFLLLSDIWEFNVFLETDMYNYLSDFLNIENLRSDAIKYITLQTKKWKQVALYPIKWLLTLFLQNNNAASDDLRLLTKSERSKLRIYVIFLIFGLIFVTGEFIFYNIPRDFTFIVFALHELIQSAEKLGISFFKSLVIIGIVLLNYILLIFLKGKDIVKRRHKNMHF